MVEEEEYDDFLKEDDSPGDSKDSFGKKIQDMYEEHKKKDTKIIHRPISSYQPNSSNNNNINNNLLLNQLGNNSNNSNKISHPKSASSKNTELPKKSFDEIINDLKMFINKNKISKNDFIENDNIFLNYEDFKSCLQNIHYNIPNAYAKVLFTHDNEEGAKDNYIFIKKFLKVIYPESDFDSSYNSHSVYNSQKTESVNNNNNINNNNTNYNNNNNNNISKSSVSINSINNKSKNESVSLYEIKYINEEYNQFNKDISNILKNDGKITKKNSINRPTSSFSSTNKLNNKRLKNEKPQKNYTTYKYTIDSNDNNNKLDTVNNQEKAIDNNNDNNNNNMNKDNKNTSNKDSPDLFIKKYNKQRLKEEKKENEKINKQFIKREEDFTKDCILKSFECNKICKELNIDKKYTIEYIDDELKCIVEEKKRKIYITLKEFIVEYRRLNKKYLNKDVEERYMGREEEKKKDVEVILKERENEKNEKLKDIKEVLIEAVRLKTKLKNQLNNLKSNIKLDEKIVIEHLVKAGINFPEYNQEYNEEMNKNDNNNNDDNNNDNNNDDNNNKIN